MRWCDRVIARDHVHHHPLRLFHLPSISSLAMSLSQCMYVACITRTRLGFQHYRRSVIGPISNIAAHFLIPRFDTSLNGARGGGGPLDVLQYHSSTLSSSSPPALLISFPRGFVNCKNAHDHLLQQQWHRRIHDKCKPSVVWKCCHCKSRRELSKAP